MTAVAILAVLAVLAVLVAAYRARPRPPEVEIRGRYRIRRPSTYARINGWTVADVDTDIPAPNGWFVFRRNALRAIDRGDCAIPSQTPRP